MSAREEILARVRSALADVDRADVDRAAASAAQAPAVPADGSPPLAGDALVDLFCERVADYRAVVERCAEHEVAERVRAALPEGASVVVPEGLDLDVPGALVDHAGLDAASLDRVDAVVTRARVGIAETGTIVLDHGPGQGRRANSLVPDRHVCIVRADQVVVDVPDAVALLDPSRPLTWISGPSATSDIELDRVEGVHGPRALHVIVVD